MRTMQESELLSWKAIWQAAQNGKQSGIVHAIDDHVERFPASEQDEVRLRTIHIVRNTQRSPEEVRGHLRRVSSTIRTLQKGRFNAHANEDGRHEDQPA